MGKTPLGMRDKALRTEWTPIFSPGSPLWDSAWAAVEQIGLALLNHEYPVESQTKFRRHAHEEAILYAYLAAATGELRWTQYAVNQLNRSIDRAHDLRGALGLNVGLCGLAWTVDHLAKLLGPSLGPAAGTSNGEPVNGCEGSDLTADVDELLLRQLRKDPWQGELDLISGLVGVGVYFLERVPRPSAVEGLTLIVRHLNQLCERSGSFVTWRSNPESLSDSQRARYPTGFFDLGVAHGVPGIMYLLNEVDHLGIHGSLASQLLDGAMKWFWAQRRQMGSVSRFAAWVPDCDFRETRMGWCYGDLGILVVLGQIATDSNREDWKTYVRDLTDHCLVRAKETIISEDMAICHGTVGVAHLLNRISQRGDIRYREVALSWYQKTIELRATADDGIGGCFSRTQVNPDGSLGFEANPGMVGGAVGIALALLAAVSPVSPNWDRCLLVSGSRLATSRGQSPTDRART